MSLMIVYLHKNFKCANVSKNVVDMKILRSHLIVANILVSYFLYTNFSVISSKAKYLKVQGYMSNTFNDPNLLLQGNNIDYKLSS